MVSDPDSAELAIEFEGSRFVLVGRRGDWGSAASAENFPAYENDPGPDVCLAPEDGYVDRDYVATSRAVRNDFYVRIPIEGGVWYGRVQASGYAYDPPLTQVRRGGAWIGGLRF